MTSAREVVIETVAFQDFAKLQLRTAKVLSVEPHPDAERLYLIKIDGGDEERQLVAGLRPYYEPDELAGKTIVVVWNLEPAKIRGQVSQGMLLAAQEGDTVSVLSPDKPISPGQQVR